MSSSKQVILQMHFICFSFENMTSVQIWRDEVKAAENLLFTPAVVKNGLEFEIAPDVRNVITYRHSGLKLSNWKFHVNIAYAQVNPLCSCQSSRAVLIIGRRKLALLQSGMAFSVFSIFMFIISIIFVPISLIFSYFRLSIRKILTESRGWAVNHAY